MVYCGKPSKGCSNCRERKIRCDQRTPTCGQCEKRQQQCPGYRNIVDLMFRDESHHVIERATATRRRSKQAGRADAVILNPPPSPARSSPSSSPSSATRKPKPLMRDVSPSSEEDDTAECAPRQTPRGRLSGASHVGRLQNQNCGSRASSALTTTTKANDARISYGLTNSLQERGIAFFFARYVATDHGCYQNYDFIYDVWKPPLAYGTDSTDCITASMAAVGLASLSKLTRCPETFRRARQSYTVALGLANSALSSPTEAVKDGTMLAVLILGTYEFVSGRTPQTIRAWQDHVSGAATLASMRGAAQFRTKAGTRMFVMLCHTVLISCIRSGLPMPQSMVDLRRELWHLTDTSGPIWRVVDALYNALQVRHDIKSGNVSGVDTVVKKLCNVEEQFSALISTLPPGWYYHQAKLSKPHPAVLGDACHIYRDLTQATTWNGIRTMRMLVQETIVEVLCGSTEDPTLLPSHHQLQLVKAMKLIQMLGEAFVSSVPQHFGIVSGKDLVCDRRGRHTVEPIPTAQLPHRILSPSSQKALPGTASSSAANPNSSLAAPASRKPTLFDPTQSSGHERGAERFLALATASHTIIWPLYTLGMSSSTTPDTLAYVLDRLEAIYQETGFEQARVVSNIVKEQVHTLLWDQIPTAKLPSLPDAALPMMV
ncbi:Zn(2)-C6 fungal-type DNA-binding domain protein [Metarhizium album ARSEF 1941]|uniref:Zn(2)-C6 fungal-type DNA-binding domain protein n=1 Tax=Metarhizium album (strain ARSEF 1941) TaxID=1081103 RepID=A0A0B2X544_METAS|nr:Zn(2)-C6 fungal-type DNA-binding domain protein [Metarhizium album ARSEF 1941]KHO00858.1 Zn(2)-C6 fungal-type DNA-binding domain protein [Metarhizium album ARSEF 1941]